MHHTRKGTKVNRTEHRKSIQSSFQPGFNGTARYGLLRSGARSLRLAAVFVSVIVVFALSASLALGDEHHSYSDSFGSPGQRAGQISLVSPEDGGVNSGIAVNDETHVLYVADTGNRRVDEFSAAGKFIGAWGMGVADGRQELETCVTTCQAGVEPESVLLHGLSTPSYIAVDNSAGLSKGDVYVANNALDSSGYNSVDKFTSTGELVRTWGTDGELNGSTSPGGPTSQIDGIATSASGDLLVADDNYFHQTTRLLYFDESGSFQKEVELPHKFNVEILKQRGIAVDDSSGPSDGDIYGAASQNQGVKFSATGKFLYELDPERSSLALAVDSSNGDVYVSHPGYVATYDSIGIPRKVRVKRSVGRRTSRTDGSRGGSLQPHCFPRRRRFERIDVFLSVTTPGLTVAPPTNIERESATVAGRSTLGERPRRRNQGMQVRIRRRLGPASFEGYLQHQRNIRAVRQSIGMSEPEARPPPRSPPTPPNMPSTPTSAACTPVSPMTSDYWPATST